MSYIKSNWPGYIKFESSDEVMDHGEVIDVRVPVVNDAGVMQDPNIAGVQAGGRSNTFRYIRDQGAGPQPLQVRVEKTIGNLPAENDQSGIPSKRISDWVSFDEATAFLAAEE